MLFRSPEESLLTISKFSSTSSMDSPTGSIRGKDPEDETGVVAVDTSNEISGGPDPRWPYLNRWTQNSPSSPSVNPTGPKETTKDVQSELQMTSSQVKKSSDEGIPVQPSLPVAPAKTPSSPLSPSLKGAWTVPLNLNRRLDTLSNLTGPNLIKKPILGDVFPKISGPLAPAMDSHIKTTQEDAIRFPWDAKMDPSSRNLYRATSPEYMEDGTPKVTIPSHVLLQGLENQKEYVLGQFYRCNPPPGGLVYAVVDRIWGRKCRIFVRKLGDSKFLFHIPDASTRAWVLQRGLWHVDDCLMFVAPWSTTDSLEIPDISTVPVWVTLKNIPNRLYSIPGISHIASGLGAPMATYKPRLDPTLMGEAKILVEVELSKAFPPKIAAADKKGYISMVDVEYAWVPTKCDKCGQLGHKASRCASKDFTPACDASTSDVTGLVSPNTTLPDPSIYDFAIVSEAHVPPPTINKDKGTKVVANQKIVNIDVVVEATSAIQSDKVMTGTKDQEGSTDCPILATKTSVGKDIVKNRFNALGSSEPDEDSHNSVSDSEMLDLMTPSGQRLLRERPVKPSFKAKEMQSSSKARGRGSRGRGNRGGHG